MRTLLIMRHGKAANQASHLGDHDRPLTPEGITAAQHQAVLHPPAMRQTMLISSARRTQQTAQALMETWTAQGQERLPEHRSLDQGYLAPAALWMDLLSLVDDHSTSVWIIGHNPGISELIVHLTGDYCSLSTADIARIDLNIESWSHIAPASGVTVFHHPGRGA